MMFAFVAAAVAAKAPVSLQQPIWVDTDPLQPRICVSFVPDAGPFRGKDAEVWSQIRAHVEKAEIAEAIRLSRDLKPHPAQRMLKAAAYLMGDGQIIDIEGLVHKYGEDPCLAAMASGMSLKSGNTADMVRHVERAHELWPDNPDVGELFALAAPTPAERAVRFRQAVEDFPDDLSLRYTVATLAEADGDVATAVAGYRRVWELGYPEVEEKLLRLALRSGDLDTYLRMVMTEDHPVKGPGFGDQEDYGKAYLDWLGIDSLDTPLYAIFQTNQGDIRCRLATDNAPVTIMNFVGLARGSQPWTRNGVEQTGPLYDGTLFHRVIPEFMIQGGDPEGTGRGSPGYVFGDEPSPVTALDRPGMLAMANSGPNTNGSQFFISEKPTPHLSGKHTLFGYCDQRAVQTVRKIARVPAESDRPKQEVILETIRFE